MAGKVLKMNNMRNINNSAIMNKRAENPATIFTHKRFGWCKMKKLFIYYFLVLGVSLNAQSDSLIYSFFTAGHTYGNPKSPHYGLHYPFVDYIDTLNAHEKIKLGFLTGDVVPRSTADYWDSAQVDINKFNMPIYIAAGNHDMSPEFTKRFGPYYSAFTFNDDLFIILTPGLNAWSIAGNQLKFLRTTLYSNYNHVYNIFIILHELIWWSPDNKYNVVTINYAPHFPGSTNFDNVVKPLLLSFPNHITIFAGDLGCKNKVSSVMYDSFDNITLIGSGMGGGVRDNIIITNVYPNSVDYDLIAISGDDPNALGELTDYCISPAPLENTLHVKIYPNLSSGYLYINNNSDNNVNCRLYDLSGKKLIDNMIEKKSVSTIRIKNIGTGIYFVALQNQEGLFLEKKLIKIE